MSQLPNNEDSDIFQHSFGEALRAARCAQKLSIEDVAKQLRLSREMIEALESEDLKVLSTPIYVNGYLRNYARLINIPVEPLLAAYAKENAASPEIISEAVLNVKPSSFVTAFIRGSVVVLTVAVLGGFIAWKSMGNDVSNNVAAISEQNNEVDNNIEETVRLKKQVQVEDLAKKESITPIKTEIVAEKIVEPEEIIKPEKIVKSEKNVSAAIIENITPEQVVQNSVELVLNFNADCWTEIRDSKGNKLIFDLMREGKEKKVRGIPPFEVFFGNATAVDVEYDGQRYNMKRHVRGDLARFQLGRATAEKSDDG